MTPNRGTRCGSCQLCSRLLDRRRIHGSGRSVKGLREATARRDALDAAAASWTLGRRGRRSDAVPTECRVSRAGLRELRRGARRPAGPSEAEAGAPGPGAAQRRRLI